MMTITIITTITVATIIIIWIKRATLSSFISVQMLRKDCRKIKAVDRRGRERANVHKKYSNVK